MSSSVEEHADGGSANVCAVDVIYGREDHPEAPGLANARRLSRHGITASQVQSRVCITLPSSG